MPTIELPNNWQPRKHQFPLWDYLQKGGTRAIEIAHRLRRWGKDDVMLHWAAVSIHQRPASLWHCLPLYSQARKAIWTAVNPHTGKRRIDEAFPHELRENTNEQEMFIRFKNGGTWQVVGSDRYNTLVGSGVAGVTFSEWALCNPSAWGYIRPMVEENNGWAAFITTPRGNNHAKSMYDMAVESPHWFSDLSSVKDTGALTAEQLAESLEEYISLYGADLGRAQFEQEYLCSWSAAMMGAYWGAEVAQAEREGRITDVSIDWSEPVHTAWDLGKAVNNPIWCFQVIKGKLRIVDFYRPESDDLEEWCAELNSRGYHGTDYVPHDIMHTDWGVKRTRRERLIDAGRKPKQIGSGKAVSVAEGINAGRESIKLAMIDATRCELGIEGLKNYRREWDDELKTFRENPVKDWAEHIGSSFRYLGLAWRDAVVMKEPPEKPKTPVYTANPDGSVTSNVTVEQAVKAMIRRKNRIR